MTCNSEFSSENSGAWGGGRWRWGRSGYKPLSVLALRLVVGKELERVCLKHRHKIFIEKLMNPHTGKHFIHFCSAKMK